MSESLYALKEEAVENFKEQVFDKDYDDLLTLCQQDEVSDIVGEVADSNVPVYTATILALAANDIELATEPSPLRDDGSPIDTITDNIYCALQAAQYEWWNDNKDEIEAEAQLVIDAEEAFDDAVEGNPGIEDNRTSEQIADDVVAGIDEDELSVVQEGERLAEVVWNHLDKRNEKRLAKEKDAQKNAP